MKAARWTFFLALIAFAALWSNGLFASEQIQNESSESSKGGCLCLECYRPSRRAMAAWLEQIGWKEESGMSKEKFFAALEKKSLQEIHDMAWVRMNGKDWIFEGKDRLWKWLSEALILKDSRSIPELSLKGLESWQTENLVENHYQKPNVRSLELWAMLEGKTSEEILALIQAIEKDVKSEKKGCRSLEYILVGGLVRKDPERAFRFLADRADKESFSSTDWLGEAFGSWVKKEPEKAKARLDAEIATRSFESKFWDFCNSRATFEGDVIESLLTKNPGEAEKRLAVSPNSKPAAYLTPFLTLLKVSVAEHDSVARLAYAGIVRRIIPEPKIQKELLIKAIEEISGADGLEQAADFLQQIQVNPKERPEYIKAAACAFLRSKADEITRADVEAVRQWLTLHSPEMASDSAIGELLVTVASSQCRQFAIDRDIEIALECGISVFREFFESCARLKMKYIQQRAIEVVNSKRAKKF